MSKVALRVYNREIETLIDQGHIDEAVAHCQHILKSYPKHLDTYRLLGKAYLEARRYADAADIFLRVLLAAPDDFVSHLGMSIIRDEQKDLEGAIWHMERAFDVNASNGGVQGELKRLYGRRDGLEPPKIRLTRGALAQMYTRGGQFAQAIVEIKAVLAEDETRNDMKNLLARAYFRAGMKIEATEACIDLLKHYPYSLDGNRILVEMLPGTSMAQSVDQYKRRLQSLDPYTSVATGSVFDTENIPDNAVMVDRLDYEPDSQSDENWNTPVSAESSQPAAVATPVGEIPDWLQQSGWGPSNGEFKDGPVNFDESESAPLAADDGLAAAEIPDWLKAMAPPGAGTAAAESQIPVVDDEADFDWLEGLGAPLGEPEQQPAAVVEPVAPEIIPAPEPAVEDDQVWSKPFASDTLPLVAESAVANSLDWMNEQPPPQEEQPADQLETLDSEPLPDWLNEEVQAVAPVVSQPVAEQPEAEIQEIPDWLNDLGADELSLPIPDLPANEKTTDWISEEPVAEKPELDSQPAAEKVPDWLSGLAASESATKADAKQFSDVGIPDWLGDLSTPKSDVPTQPVPAVDWLTDLSAESAGEQPLSSLETGSDASDAELDESLKWLDGLTEKQGVKPDEPVEFIPGAAESRQDDAFGWLESQASGQDAKPEEQAEKTPDWLSEMGAPSAELSSLISGPGTSESEQDDAFGWLESLASGQGAKPEELLTKPEDRADKAPDWLSEVETPPSELSSLISGPGTSESEQDEALAWLESLAQKQGAKTEELITNPDERQENVPDWVAQVGQQPETVLQPDLSELPVSQEPPSEIDESVLGPLSELVSGPGTSESEQDAALSWLEALAQKQGAKPEELITQPDARQESAPDWIAQIGQQPVASVEAADEVNSAPQETQDEALDWLQGLADEQPVAPVEANSAPQETQDEALDWLQGLADEQPVASVEVNSPPVESQDEALDWLQGLSDEQPIASVEANSAPLESQDEALDWLQGLSDEEPVAPAEAVVPIETTVAPQEEVIDLQQGLSDELPVAIVAPVESLVTPLTAQDDVLSWLQGLSDAESEQPVSQRPAEQPADVMNDVSAISADVAETGAAEVEDGLDWLGDLNKSAEAAIPSMPWEQAETLPAESPIDQPVKLAADESLDWLSDLGQEEAQASTDRMPWEQEIHAPEVEPVAEAVETEPEESAGVPEEMNPFEEQEKPVVSAVEPVEIPAEEPAPVAPVESPNWFDAEPVKAVSTDSEIEELPAWLKDTSADEQLPVPEQVSDWVVSQEIPAETEPPVSEAAPKEPVSQASAEPVSFSVMDVAPVEESAPVESAPVPVLKSTAILGGDKDAQIVQRARDLLGHGGLDGAMNEYSKLIKKGKMLEEVIYDLKEAVYSHPVDVVIWQTLGDAYNRSNRLQEALDAYSKAEELLR